MYEPHKDNLERIETENRRISSVERRCQEAIRGILEGEKMEARIVFYPKTQKGTAPDWKSLQKQVTDQFQETLKYLHESECTCSPLTKNTDSPHEPECELYGQRVGAPLEG